MKYGYFKGKKVAEVQDSQISLMDRFKKRGLVDEWRDTESDPKQAAEKAASEKAEAERLAAEKAEADRLAAEKEAAEKAEAERLAVEKEAAEKAKDQHHGGGGGQSGMGGDKRNN
jgi:membrane protein involved in colicin uptake